MTDPQRSGPADFGASAPQAPDLWGKTSQQKNPAAHAAAEKAGAAAPGWERQTLEKLLFATLAEQRATRRWRIFWRLTWIGFFVAGI